MRPKKNDERREHELEKRSQNEKDAKFWRKHNEEQEMIDEMDGKANNLDLEREAKEEKREERKKQWKHAKEKKMKKK